VSNKEAPMIHQELCERHPWRKNRIKGCVLLKTPPPRGRVIQGITLANIIAGSGHSTKTVKMHPIAHFLVHHRRILMVLVFLSA
jgi:hypothetical protein